MLEGLVKPNVLAVFGLAVATAALPMLVPEWRPAVKAAIKFGVTLFAESEGEAEAELVQSLIATTIATIREELAKPPDAGARGDAVHSQIRRFKHRARRRSRHWDGDAEGCGRVYRRHVAGLQAALAHQQSRQNSDREHEIITDALEALAES